MLIKDKERKPTINWEKITGVVVTVIVMIGLVVGTAFVAAYYENRRNIEKFNDGICTECQGEYKLFHVNSTERGLNYIYKCENCDYIISTTAQMERNNY